MRRFRGAVALVSLLALVCCTGDARQDELTVFAAASLTDAFGALAARFEAQHPDVDVTLSLAGSSSLREQILAGAPADVFAPADTASMQAAVEAGEVAGDPRPFATNTLTIAVPEGNPGGVTGLADLADDDLLVGLCAEAVPCGRLGRRLLAERGVEPSVDTDEPDVRSLLTKLAAGELDAGLVYVTDVRSASDEIDEVQVDGAGDVVATYPIAALASSAHADAAAAFVDLVVSPEGQAILAEHGFGAP